MIRNQPRLLALLSVLGLWGAACSRSGTTIEATPIRIGWQTPWATQGQITQSLAHTNILARNGFQAEFQGFSYGGPLNEAALGGAVDVMFTADQPAAMLLAAGGDFMIIGRLMYNRVAVYVPPESPIASLADLKNKRVAIPFGAAAQRDALKAIQEAGLDPDADIESINLDIMEQSALVQAGTRESWGDIDALVGFDPTPAIFEHQGLARMLHVGKVVSLVLMSKPYMAAHPSAPERFLNAFTEAVFYYATHQEQANRWFQEASNLEFDPQVLDIAASVEPNVKAASIADIRITLTDADLAVMQEAADFILARGLIKKDMDMRAHVDQAAAQKVESSFDGGGYDPGAVEVVSP